MNIPQDAAPPRSAVAPTHRLSLRTREYEDHFVRDVEIIAIGWTTNPSDQLSYLVFDPRAEDDRRVYWVRGDYAQQIRHAG